MFRFEIIFNILSSYLNFFLSFLSIFIVVPGIQTYIGESFLSIWFLSFSFLGYVEFMLASFSQAHLIELKTALNFSFETEKAETLRINRLFCNQSLLIILFFFIAVGVIYFAFILNGKFSAMNSQLLLACITVVFLFAIQSASIPLSNQILVRHQSWKLNLLSSTFSLLYLPGFWIVSSQTHSFSAVLCWLIFIEISKWFVLFLISPQKHIYLLSFSLPDRAVLDLPPFTKDLLILGFVTILGFKLDLLIVGFYCSQKMIISYGAAQKLYNIAQNLAWQLPSVLLPSFLVLKDEKKEKQLMLVSTKVALTILCTTLFPMFFYGEDFLKIWIGEKFSKDAYLILVILGLHLFFNTQHSSLSFWLKSKKQTEDLKRFYTRVNLLNISLSLILGWIWGALGIALATTLPFFLMELPFLITTLRKCSILKKQWIFQVNVPIIMYAIWLSLSLFYLKNYLYIPLSRFSDLPLLIFSYLPFLFPVLFLIPIRKSFRTKFTEIP